MKFQCDKCKKLKSIKEIADLIVSEKNSDGTTGNSIFWGDICIPCAVDLFKTLTPGVQLDKDYTKNLIKRGKKC